MNTIGKKILVVGSSASAYSLVRYLSNDNFVEKIFVASGNDFFSEYAECIDIREDCPTELLDFVLENDISLTIVTSLVAIKSDIVDIFNSSAQMIFAPSGVSSLFLQTSSAMKKFLYKLRIPTPKFGVFDKPQLALEYIKSANYPLIITSDEPQKDGDSIVCANISLAKMYIEDFFVRGEKKLVIEDYTYGHDFTFYVLTDGYQTLPVVSVADYKFASDGDGGFYTFGVGAFAPDYKVSNELEYRLMKDVACRIVNSLSEKGTPYIGILGIDVTLKEDASYCVRSFTPFFKDHDADIFLYLLKDNFLPLMRACVLGSFADDYEVVSLNGKSAVSVVVSSTGLGEKIVQGLSEIDESFVSFINLKRNIYSEFLIKGGRSFVLTKTASTLSRARSFLYDDLECINFNGIKYRKDICSPTK